jgi:hypothetical protein
VSLVFRGVPLEADVDNLLLRLPPATTYDNLLEKAQWWLDADIADSGACGSFQTCTLFTSQPPLLFLAGRLFFGGVAPPWRDSRAPPCFKRQPLPSLLLPQNPKPRTHKTPRTKTRQA